MFSKPVDSYSLLRSLELILRMPSPSGIGLVVVTAVIFYLRFCKSAGLFLKVPVMLDHVFLCHVALVCSAVGILPLSLQYGFSVASK